MILSPDLVDVPIEVFGGYTPAIPPQDLPPGASPFNQDVVFPLGAVRQRGGLKNLGYTGIPGAASINGLKTYSTPTLAQRLMVWDSLGNFSKESPEGTISAIASRPYAGLLYQSTTLFGREYQALFNSTGGFDIPHQYDDTNWDRVSHSGPGASPTIIDSATAGSIVAGKHQVAVAFINRQGWISQASPAPTAWTAAGSKQAAVSNIPTGPPNIIGRLLLFTPVITAPATTGSFYSTPTGTTQLATPTAMLINDNITTTLTVDFLDVILIASFQANYLFVQLELGETSFSFGYNSRLGWLGERNKQTNFVNMGFDGGFGTAGGGGAGTNILASPSVAVSDGTLGGTSDFTVPNNVFVADGLVATATMAAGAKSKFIKATGYGFAIPSNATITGILVKALVKATNNVDVSDDFVRLYKNGALVGTDHQTGTTLTTILTYINYGGSADLWGTTWTPTEINNVNFGAGWSAFNNHFTLNRQAFIDYMSITVYYTTPATGATVGPWGWTQGATYAGGSSALTKGLTADYGDAYAITGDGATAVRGLITQNANQDYLLVSLISRNTAYRVRARIALAGGLNQGTIHVNLSSITGAFTTPGLAIKASQVTGTYQEFDALLTTAIVSPPADLLIQVYADNTPNNGGVFLIDSIEVYPAGTPFNYSTVRLSHAFNPESYDATLDAIQIRPNDGQQLRAGFQIRNNYYFAKDHYLGYVTDDGVNEPAQWPVTDVSQTIGICGPNAVDTTEEWAAFAERSGVYVYWGADPVKISQEIQDDASDSGKIVWNSINWAAGSTIWLRIDKINKRILVGVPVNGALTPNVIFVLDYKWLDGAQDIASSPMVTYSAFTGKILAHGRGRRWTFWNISSNSMTFAERSDGTAQPFFGGVGNGIIYQQLDCKTQPNDNGVTVLGQYQTNYGPSSDEEMGLRLGSHRKMLGYLKWRAVGLGNLAVSIVSTVRTTVLRPYPLALVNTGDAGRGTQVHGERFSYLFGTSPIAPSTSGWWQLEKVIPCMKKDSTIVVRGVNA